MNQQTLASVFNEFAIHSWKFPRIFVTYLDIILLTAYVSRIVTQTTSFKLHPLGKIKENILT